VSLRPCGPLALILVNGKKKRNRVKIRTEKWLQCATLGSPGGDFIECMLYFSRLYRPLSKFVTWFGCLLAKIFFLNMALQKTPKQKRTFHWVSGNFRTFKVPTKRDGEKPSCIWTQWTWKLSPRSISFDADENGQSRQVQRQTPIHLYA
jgi:hypothetical protein